MNDLDISITSSCSNNINKEKMEKTIQNLNFQYQKINILYFNIFGYLYNNKVQFKSINTLKRYQRRSENLMLRLIDRNGVCKIPKERTKISSILKENRNIIVDEVKIDSTEIKNLESTSLLNSNIKDFSCSSCDKKYKSKENLNLHYINIHLNVKPYKCIYCNKKFSHRNGKMYHEKKNLCKG
jgi:hypothetical protein